MLANTKPCMPALLRIGILLLLLPFSGHANQVLRPESPQELGPASEDQMIKIQNTRVAWADYAALKRDFPQLSSLRNEEIDHWIMENFSYVSAEQTKLNEIRNTEIPVDRTKTRIAYRPLGWRRAAVIPQMKGMGMVDIKGVGHPHDSLLVQSQVSQFQLIQNSVEQINALRTKDHSDGLMSLGEAIAEVSRQQAAQHLFDIHNHANGTRLQTIESYFILQLPFRILKENNQSIPAALYARQAHVGRENYLSVPKEIYIDDFGMIQGDRFGATVDFGGVEIRNPSLANHYGPINDAPFDAQNSKPWAWGHEVANAISRETKPDHGAIQRHLNEMLEPIRKPWLASRNSGKQQSLDAEKILKKLRKWEFSNPKWYSDIYALLTDSTPAFTHEFVRHLFLKQRPTPEQNAAMAKIFFDPKAPLEAKKMLVRFLSYKEDSLPEEISAALKNNFSKMKKADQLLLAPLIQNPETETLAVLEAALSSQDEAIRHAAAVSLGKAAYESGPRTNVKKLQTALAAALEKEPLRDRRLKLFIGFLRLHPHRPEQLRVTAKIATEDPHYFARNQAIQELIDLKPNNNEIFKSLIHSFHNEPNRDNRIALSRLLVDMKPNDPDLQIFLLRAAENASDPERLIHLSRLDGIPLNNPKVKHELDRLANHPNEEFSRFIQFLGGKPEQGCQQMFNKIGK